MQWLAHISALLALISRYVINLSIICGTKCNFANLQRISNYVSTAHSSRGRGRESERGRERESHSVTPIATPINPRINTHYSRAKEGRKPGRERKATTESNINLLGHRDSQRLNKSTCIMKLSACPPSLPSSLPLSYSSLSAAASAHYLCFMTGA